VELATEELRLCETAMVSIKEAAETTELERRNRAARAVAARASLDALIQSLRLVVRSAGAEAAAVLSTALDDRRVQTLDEWKRSPAKTVDTLEAMLALLADTMKSAYQEALQDGRNRLLKEVDANLSGATSPDISLEFALPELMESIRFEDFLKWVPSDAEKGEDGPPGDGFSYILEKLKDFRKKASANPWVQLLNTLLELRDKRMVKQQLHQHLVAVTLRANTDLVRAFRAWWSAWSNTVLDELSASLVAPLTEEVSMLEASENADDSSSGRTTYDQKAEQAESLRHWIGNHAIG